MRAVRPEDKPLFVAGWSALSDASVTRASCSRARRCPWTSWRSSPRSTTSTTRRSARSTRRRGEGVGVARYVRDRERPHVAEAAVTVVDAWQHRGLGGKLLRRLCARATENRIRVFCASLFAANDAMLALFERLGEVTVTRRDGATIEIDVELPVEYETLEHTLREAAAGRVQAAAVSGFGLDNLPYGVVGGRCVVRYGDQRAAAASASTTSSTAPSLNAFLARGRSVWEATRERVIARDRVRQRRPEPLGTPPLPVAVGDFVDFYASLGARHQPRAAVPARRRAAAAELAPPARRLPRPRRLDRRLRHADRPAARPAAGVRADRGARHRARAGLRHRAGQAARDADRRGRRRATTSSASCSSTTGARATCSAGSTGRSARSSASRSRPRSRRWIVPLAALEPYLVPARAQDPEPLPYLRIDGRLGARPRARGRAQRRGHQPRQRARALLDVPAAARPCHRQRRRRAPGRPVRLGHDLGPEPGSEGSLIEPGRGVPGRRRHRRAARRGRARCPSARSEGTIVAFRFGAP